VYGRHSGKSRGRQEDNRPAPSDKSSGKRPFIGDIRAICGSILSADAAAAEKGENGATTDGTDKESKNPRDWGGRRLSVRVGLAISFYEFGTNEVGQHDVTNN